MGGVGPALSTTTSNDGTTGCSKGIKKGGKSGKGDKGGKGGKVGKNGGLAAGRRGEQREWEQRQIITKGVSNDSFGVVKLLDGVYAMR